MTLTCFCAVISQIIIFILCSADPTAAECRMDPNWLSLVSLLGACGGNGIRVRSYRLPSELNIISMFIQTEWKSGPYLCGSCQAVRMHVYTVSPSLFLSPRSAVIQETETQRGKHTHNSQFNSGADPPRGRGRLHHPHSDAERRRAGPRLGPHTHPPTK